MNHEDNQKVKGERPSELWNHRNLIVIVTVAMLIVFVVVLNFYVGKEESILKYQWEQSDEKSLNISANLSTITPTVRVFFQKSAWVDARVLSVQMWPGRGHPTLAEVRRGQEVRIVNESDDGEWSLLDQPLGGWVRTEYLRYNEKSISPRITPTSYRTYRWVKADPRLRVRSDPDTDSAIITHMAHGELLEIDQFTDDMQWAHIVAPTEGWASTRYLSLAPIE